MTVIGAVEVEVYPRTTGFESKLRSETSPAFGTLSKDAEKAGAESGGKLSKGFSKGTSGIASTLAGLGLPMGTFGGKAHEMAAGMSEVDSKGKGLTNTLSTLGGRTLLGATAGVIGIGAASVESAKKFQDSTTTIAANAGITVDAAKKIGDRFLETGGKTIYSAQQIDEAYGQVAGVLGEMAGHALSAAEAQKVMAASMNLAEGAGISLGSATEAIAKTMQAYHLGVGESAKASDILFNASRVTGVSIDQLTTGLTRVKGKLGELAPSLGESAGLLDALAKGGVTGRVAISSLSGSFNTLIGGGKPATEMAKQLGLSIFDTSGHFVGMRSVIEQLHPKLAGLTEQSQLQATKALFGASANRQLLGIIQQGSAAFDAHTRAVSRSGAAQEAAEKQGKTFQHQFDLLKAQAVDLAIKLGNILIPKLAAVASKLSEGVDWLKKHKAAAEALGIVIATVLGAAIAVFVEQKSVAFLSSLGKMVTGMGNMVKAIGTGVAKIVGYFRTEAAVAATTAGEVEAADAAVVASAETTAAGVDAALGSTGVGLIVVGLGVAAVGLATHWEESMQALEKATEVAGNFIIGILNSVIEAFNETIGELTGDIGKINELTPEEGSGIRSDEKGRGGEHFTRKEEEENENEPTAKSQKSHTQGGIMGFFMSKGLTAAQAAGIVGNIELESGNDPNSPGGGLFQTIGGRGVAQGSSVSAQIKSAWDEMVKRGEVAGIKATKTPQEAARYFETHFERPKGYNLPGEGGTAHSVQRERAAAQAFKAHPQHAKALEHNTKAIEKHTQTLTGTHTLPSSEKTKTHKAKAEGYIDPFAGAHHLVRGREDEGIDFTASPGSKVGAVGAGVIDKIISNWYKGQPLIEEKLTSGAEKGKYVYYAEQLNARVKEGQHVKAGQAIGTVAAHGTGLELGFGAGGGRTLAQATTGYKEGQKTPAAESFSKFLASVGKGGTALQVASKVFENTAKAELKKQTADQKTGQSVLSKMIAAIHSGGVKELTAVVGGKHDTELKKLENVLHHDHTSALDKLVTRLVDTHKKALAALQVALVKAAEKHESERLSREDKLHTDQAETTATVIADQTKVALDHAAEAGKVGPDLLAAQAQTQLDIIKEVGDAAIGAAKEGVDRAEGTGEAAEARAKAELVSHENWSKVADAQAQQVLDLANNAATEATAKQTKATEEQTKATEEQTKALEKTSAPAQPIYQFNIDGGAGLTGSELMTEVGWALKTGVLPPAVAR